MLLLTVKNTVATLALVMMTTDTIERERHGRLL